MNTMKKTALGLLILSAISLLAWPPIPRNPSVTVAWDLNQDGGQTAGYFVYWSTNSFYNGTNALPNPTNYIRGDANMGSRFTINDLTPGMKYYIVVTAYGTNFIGTNVYTIESLPSEEVNWTVPLQPGKPKNIHLSLEKSADVMGPWESIVQQDFPIDPAEIAFYRTKLEFQ